MLDVMRVNARKLSDYDLTALRQIKEAGNVMYDLLIEVLPDSREASLARTKLEEAVMWTVKARTA